MAKTAMQMGSWEIVVSILIKLSPYTVASTVAGGVAGGLLAIGVTSRSSNAQPSRAVSSNGGYAYALGDGASATAKGGLAIAIGTGATASTTGGISINVAPGVAAGMSVGAVIGLLARLLTGITIINYCST